MKRIVETTDVAGLDALLGEQVLLLCSNYFYTGKLLGVNETFVELENPFLVYETGAWDELHTKKFYICRQAIEAFGVSK